MEFEPYSIKAVEHLPFLTKKQRLKALVLADYNVFRLKSSAVTIDLISDSGTGTMSVAQWRKSLMADEAFAYQKSYDELCKVFKDLTGYRFILPIHQARAAESILFSTLIKKGERVFSNQLFSTTKYHLNNAEAKMVELQMPQSGDIRIDQLVKKFRKNDRIVIFSITSNYHGGQPVSISNMRKVRKLIGKGGVMIFDACRFAENAYIEAKRLGIGIRNAIKKIFSLSDIFYLSTKKDLLTNIGGVIGVRDKKLYAKLTEKILCHEGFPTHGGLAGRDLAAIAQGLREVVNSRYLSFRINQVNKFGQELKKNGVPVLEPFGCHAITIKGSDFVGRKKFPGFVGSNAIYLEGGVRTGVFYENGEVIRLAVPRRVYTDKQLEFAAGVIGNAYKKKEFFTLKTIYRPKNLENFLIRFKKI